MSLTTYCTTENCCQWSSGLWVSAVQKTIESSHFVRSLKSMQTLLECFNPNDHMSSLVVCPIVTVKFCTGLHEQQLLLRRHDMVQWLVSWCDTCLRSSKRAASRIRCFKGKKGCPKFRASVSKQNSPAMCNPLAVSCSLVQHVQLLSFRRRHLGSAVITSLLACELVEIHEKTWANRCRAGAELWRSLKSVETLDDLDDMQVTRAHQTFRTV